MTAPLDIERLPDVVRAYVRDREDRIAKLEAKVEHVMRANRTYSDGFGIRHREADERRTQLELAMRWGAILAAQALEGARDGERVRELVIEKHQLREALLARIAELESDTATTNRQDDAQIRHLLDGYTEAQARLTSVRKHADRMREWLLAARQVAKDKGAKPESVAEVDVMLADYDLAVAGFG